MMSLFIRVLVMSLALLSIIPWLLIVLKIREMRYVSTMPLAYNFLVVIFNIAVLLGNYDPTTLNITSNIIRIFGIISSLTIAVYIWQRQTQSQ